MANKSGIGFHSGSVAWLSAINRGPAALREFLQTRGLDHHGSDGLGFLTWIQNQHRHDNAMRYRMLTAALGEGLDPNGPPKALVSPLLTACMALDERAITLLLEAGANPNLGGAGPVAPLPLEPIVESAQRALEGNAIEGRAALKLAGRLASHLLDAGADPNLATRSGRHLLNDIIVNLPNCARGEPIVGFLDLFWDKGCRWCDEWDEDLADAGRFSSLPGHARMRIAQAESDRMGMATVRVGDGSNTAPSPRL